MSQSLDLYICQASLCHKSLISPSSFFQPHINFKAELPSHSIRAAMFRFERCAEIVSSRNLPKTSTNHKGYRICGQSLAKSWVCTGAKLEVHFSSGELHHAEEANWPKTETRHSGDVFYVVSFDEFKWTYMILMHFNAFYAHFGCLCFGSFRLGIQARRQSPLLRGLHLWDVDADRRVLAILRTYERQKKIQHKSTRIRSRMLQV